MMTLTTEEIKALHEASQMRLQIMHRLHKQIAKLITDQMRDIKLLDVAIKTTK